MNSLDRLHSFVPDWATVTKWDSNSLHVTGHAPLPSGAFGRTYQLIIKSTKDGGVVVSEETHNPLLPNCCVERHINPDSTFCLHIDSSKPVLDSEKALMWWDSLGDYLNHQDYSSKRRKWPMHAQLSHGDAALYQIRMEQLGESLGWKEEILASIFRGSGWLAGDLMRRSKDKSKLINVRSPCPRGCSRKHHPFKTQSCEREGCVDGCRKQHDPILRADCPYRTTVEKLVLVEYLRRQAEREVIFNLRSKGVECCGTMDGCPLSNE